VSPLAPTRTPSRNTNAEEGKSESAAAVGLGIEGGAGAGNKQSSLHAHKDSIDADGDLKPKLSARLSRWVPAEREWEHYESESEYTHSRTTTLEAAPAIVAEPAEAADAAEVAESVAESAKAAEPAEPVERIEPVEPAQQERSASSAEPAPQERSISPEEGVSAQSSRPLSAVSDISTELKTGQTLEQELDTDISAPISPVENEQTSKMAAHSRQNTSETAPTLVGESDTSQRPLSFEASPPRHSRKKSRELVAESLPDPESTTETVAPAPEPSLSINGIRAGLANHSRDNTAESILTLTASPPQDDRDRSASPAHVLREESPVRTVQGLSGDVPVSASPPPSTVSRLKGFESRQLAERPPAAAPPQPGGLMRTASTRMGAFLGRMGTIRKQSGRSPPAPRLGSFGAERRNTATSIASVKSTGNESLATISDMGEGESRKKIRLSLQDQFLSLRQQEEYAFPSEDDYFADGDNENTPVARKVSEAGRMSPVSPTKQSPESRSQRGASTPNLLRSPPMNPSLPPGTASGLAAGPAEEPQPVDWDLWQAVVQEGPSAVTKTGGEELNQAIASGIPAAIRGVIWQVLAESKNEELENVYRTLKARGTTDAEHLTPDAQRPQSVSRKSSQNNVNVPADSVEKESAVSSSRSSVHSLQSTPPTTIASPPLSVQGEEPDIKSKLLAEKQKREAAALSKLEKAIRRDMGARTSYSKFAQAAGLQDGLFGLCKAYALFDEGVGYAQGINFIAMPLLFNMAEEEAFTLLVRLMSKYDLRSMFTGDMTGLHMRLYQFERLLEDQDPALYCHLRRRKVSPELYACQWFLTLFAYRFPLQLVLRVYDLVFSEGLTAIMKFGLVLMQHNRNALLGMKDMGQLTNFLKEKLFDVYIDKSPTASSLLDSGFFGSVTGGADKDIYRADEMVRDACAIQITEETLAQYKSEWEESQRERQERESELEDLRASHNALSVKVKALEERTQQQDTEHVTIAGDLVRIKVENDTLADENEGLKVKVEEVQRLVDSQPAEIEAKLQEEMDRIVQRNSEVQSENRVLKEEMEEMEHELVNAKMQRAQVCTYKHFDLFVTYNADFNCTDPTGVRRVDTEMGECAVDVEWLILGGVILLASAYEWMGSCWHKVRIA
jgi:hypothetical protein